MLMSLCAPTKFFLPAFNASKIPSPPVTDLAARFAPCLEAAYITRLVSNARKCIQEDTGTLFNETSWKTVQDHFNTSALLKMKKKLTNSFAVIADRNRKLYALYSKEELYHANDPLAAVSIKLIQDLTTKEFAIVKITTNRVRFNNETQCLAKRGLLLGTQSRFKKNGRCKYYMMMKLVSGVTLAVFKEFCKEQKIQLSEQEQAQILLSMLTALQGLFADKIMHNELHEGNIIFDPNTLHTEFIDFENAKLLGHLDAKASHRLDLAQILKEYTPLINDPKMLTLLTNLTKEDESTSCKVEQAIIALKLFVQPLNLSNNSYKSHKTK